MLTARENWLKAISFEKPEWVPNFVTDANVYKPPFWDDLDEEGRDFCNVRWIFDDYGHMPDFSQPAMSDISDWRNIIKWPDIDNWDWEKIAHDFKNGENYDPSKLTACIANTAGIFLIPINMMGWEDGLCAIYEDPEEHEAITEAITEFLCRLIGYMCEYIQPDLIMTGDDFAAAEGPFISKETFNAIYRERLTRIAEACHAGNAKAEFHCCGRCDYIVKAVADCHYDIIQLPVPNNDLIADLSDLKGQLAMTGGWARHSEAGMPGASEECVRESVRYAIDTFGKDGGLVFWDGGIIGNSEDSKQKLAWLTDELTRYGHQVYKD